MGRYEEPPFQRGETYFQGVTIDTSDLTNIGGEDYEGREYEVQDEIHGSGAAVRLRVVRNMSATPVTASQCVKPDTTDGMFNRRVNGVASGAAQRCYVADELLPAGGVPQYDLFYVVVDGPALAVNTHTSPSTLAVGDRVVSAAGGRINKADYSGSGATLAGQLLNLVGTVIGQIPAAGSEADASYLVEVADQDD
jgi:hypothetical protein